MAGATTTTIVSLDDSTTRRQASATHGEEYVTCRDTLVSRTRTLRPQTSWQITMGSRDGTTTSM